MVQLKELELLRTLMANQGDMLLLNMSIKVTLKQLIKELR